MTQFWEHFQFILNFFKSRKFATILGFSIAIILGFSIAIILVFFVDQDGAPNVIMNLGLALSSILIVAGIFILDPFKENEKKFDKHVILAKVIKPISLVRNVLIIFIPFIFWSHNAITNSVITLISLYGMKEIINCMYNMYKWIQERNTKIEISFQNHFRKSFLENIPLKEFNIFYAELLSEKNKNIEFEKIIINSLKRRIYDNLDTNTGNILFNILCKFNENLSNRQLVNREIYKLINEIIIDIILHLNEYEKYKENHVLAKQELNSIIINIVSWPLKQNNNEVLYHYYDIFEIIKNKKNIISIDGFKKSIFVIFDKLTNENYSSFFNCFPDKWKMTLSHSDSTEEKEFKKNWANIFLDWVGHRTIDGIPPNNFKLLLKEIFPDSSQEILSALLSWFIVVGSNLQDIQKFEKAILVLPKWKSIDYISVPTLDFQQALQMRESQVREKENQTFDILFLWGDYFQNIPLDAILEKLETIEVSKQDNSSYKKYLNKLKKYRKKVSPELERVMDDEEPEVGGVWGAKQPDCPAVEPFVEAASLDAADAGRPKPSAAGGHTSAELEDERVRGALR